MKNKKKTFSREYVELLKKYGILPTSMDQVRQVLEDSIVQDALEVDLGGHLGNENTMKVILQIKKMDIHTKMQKEFLENGFKSFKRYSCFH